MPIDFPKNASTDDTYTYLTTTWKWNGTAWERSAATETGNEEGNTGEVAYYSGKGSIIAGATAFFYGGAGVGIGTSGPTELLDVRGGITASGIAYIAQGITCSGDITLAGNLNLPEDGWVGIGGDTERIVFNGEGSGSSSINIRAGLVDFGTGSGSKLRSKGDDGTYIQFVNDEYGGGNDGFHLVQDGNRMISINPTGVDIAGISFGTRTAGSPAGATFNGPVGFGDDVVVRGGISAAGATFDAVSIHGGITASGGKGLYVVGGVTCDSLQVDGEIVVSDNIIVTEDKEIQIGGDSDKIVFNAGSGQIKMDFNEVQINRYVSHAGDGNTKMQFQADQWTLTCGGADVIDANATSVNFADIEVQRPKLKDYSETALATSTKSASFNVDFEDGNVQSFTCADDLTVSFTNPPASGIAGTVTLIITNGGANTTTWNAAVKWPGDNAPALTSSGVDIVSFMTIDAGTTVYGFVGGINFS